MKNLIAFILIVFLVSAATGTKAKRAVKIATIGAVPPNLDYSQPSQKLVEQMMGFWKNELSQVLPDLPDLIVLPEVCTRPTGMNAETSKNYYETRGEQLTEYFASVAKENHCYIAFGALRIDKNNYWRNSGILLDRQGETVGIYDKVFPTIGEMERGTKAGKEAPVFECDFGRLAFAICFDLNFDELCERYAEQKPDIIVFPALYHGGLKQADWAYTCRSYFVGSIGIRNLPSEIRNPMGKVIATSTNYFHYTVATVNLDYCVAHLDNNWAKLKAMKKKYGEKVTIYDPGEIAPVLITSESDNISAKEMAKEFDITLLDEYLNNSRQYRLKPGVLK
jgi:Skp family chaperone for outer membrane proteins